MSGTTVSAGGDYSVDGTNTIPCAWTGTTRADLDAGSTANGIMTPEDMMAR